MALADLDAGKTVCVRVYAAPPERGLAIQMELRRRQGSGNTFLAKLDIDGNEEYIKQWGTTENDYGLSVAVDYIDNIFVVGNTLGTFEDNINSGENDIFLIKWNEF